MKRQWCPDFGALSVTGGYLAMITFYREEPMKVITPPTGRPQVHPSAHAAREAAKDWYQALEGRRIRAETMAEPDDVLGIDLWRQQKAAEADQERARVFGTSTIYPGRGRSPVVVERRKRA